MWGTPPRVFDRACTYYVERTALVDADLRLTVNPAGKVDKKSLRAQFWTGRSRQVG